MTVLGIATGCLHPAGVELLEAVGHIQRLGAEGVELTFSDADHVKATDPDALPRIADRFSFVTVHAPIRTSVDDEDDLAWVRRLE